MQMQTQANSNWMNDNVSSDFKRREFLCRCCNKEGIKDEMIFHLQVTHDLLPVNNVMIINSAYRCKEHNREVGGKETSSHIKGLAADIKCDDSNFRFVLVRALLRAGFKRIGIGKNFVHADLDREKTQNLIWVY